MARATGLWYENDPMTPDSDTSYQHSGNRQSILELLVPGLSFGFTILGILLWLRGFDLPFQFFSAGCIAGSCILAYLAWIRPHRDIVALTTPVYAFIFFLVPSDGVSWIVLQLLYAVSLTALLIRLKLRFGSAAPVPGAPGEDPLDDYIIRVARLMPEVRSETAREAGAVFIRFAQAEYATVARIAGNYSIKSGDGAYDQALATAFAIVASQADDIIQCSGNPETFIRFAPEDVPVLFHIAGNRKAPETEYSVALDNALLLLYAVSAAHAPVPRNTEVRSHGKFAKKLADL